MKRSALKESVSLSLSIDDRWGLGFAFRGLGIVAHTQEEHLEAVDLFRKSLESLTDLGARQDMGLYLPRWVEAFSR